MNILEEVEEIKKRFSINYITYRRNSLYNAYKIVKDNNFSNNEILPKPLIIENDKKNKQFNGNDILTSVITKFLLTISNKISPENLKILNNNLKDITLHDHNYISLIRNLYLVRKRGYVVCGGYDGVTNSIYINSSFENKLFYVLGLKTKMSEEKISYFLYHELFHMSSSVYNVKTNTIYSGFKQLSDKMIGTAITEGYTEYLVRKFFGPKDIKNDNIYLYEVFCASLIEDIIGEEKLEKFYFNADLESLVNELSKYSNREDTIQFFLNCDINLQNRKFGKTDMELISNIEKYIMNVGMKKNLFDLQKGIISEDECLLKGEAMFDKMTNFYKHLKIFDTNEEEINKTR